MSNDGWCNLGRINDIVLDLGGFKHEFLEIDAIYRADGAPQARITTCTKDSTFYAAQRRTAYNIEVIIFPRLTLTELVLYTEKRRKSYH